MQYASLLNLTLIKKKKKSCLGLRLHPVLVRGLYMQLYLKIRFI